MKLIYKLGLAWCVALTVFTTGLWIASWWGGKEGYVMLATNMFHERLIETILFVVASVIGVIWLFREASCRNEIETMVKNGKDKIKGLLKIRC